MSAPMPPGWYENPETPSELRWFDGAAWSQFTKDRPEATTAPAAVPAPAPAPVPVPTGRFSSVAARAGTAHNTPTGPLAAVSPAAASLPQPRPAPAAVLPASGATSSPGPVPLPVAGGGPETAPGGRLPEWLLPPGGAWQAVVAGYLGIVTVVCAIWPLVGLGAWALTAAFAGWALLRLRRDVLLGGRWRALAGLASGVAPLWTTVLMLAYR